MKQQILKTVILHRLNLALNAQLGMQALATLIYGWTRKDPKLRININHRNWLFDYEVQQLSDYAGYDLLISEL
jgi:hypothetical protein